MTLATTLDAESLLSATMLLVPLVCAIAVAAPQGRLALSRAA